MGRIKDILVDQREELKFLFENRKMVERENMKEIKRVASSRLIKVITGVRRSGKSFLTYHLVKDKNFAYVNFDDIALSDIHSSTLMRAINEIYGKVEVLFLDEVQNHESWETLIGNLYRQGYNIFVTGSNSKLLSKEFASKLTGRYVSIEIFPFSFREVLASRGIELSFPLSSSKKGTILHILREYIYNGGFPEVVVNNENYKIYLRSLFDQIIKKDILFRYKIRYAKTFQEMANVLLSNPSSYITLSKLRRMFKLRSEHTVKNYLYYLEEAYLMFFLLRFSYKPKEIELGERKVYAIDTGLVNHSSHHIAPNLGPLIENVVALELLRKEKNTGNEIFYYKTQEGYEVDFLIKEGTKIKELVQVSYANSYEEVQEREIRALLHAKEDLKLSKDVKLTVITWDYEDEQEIEWWRKKGKIRFVPLWKWLLSKE